MSAHTTAAAKAAPSTLILLREDIAGVAVLTLNDPETRNSLSEAMLEALGDALTAIAHDKSVRVVVLAANGPAFSAGHNLKELSRRRSDEDGGRAYFKHMMATCSTMMQQIVKLPQPVIAAVQATATAASSWQAAISRSPRGPQSSPRPASISVCSARPRWSRSRATFRPSTQWRCF